MEPKGGRAKLTLHNLSHKLKVRKVRAVVREKDFYGTSLLALMENKLRSGAPQDCREPLRFMRAWRRAQYPVTRGIGLILNFYFCSFCLYASELALAGTLTSPPSQTFTLGAVQATVGGDVELSGKEPMVPEWKWQVDTPLRNLADVRLTGAGFTVRSVRQPALQLAHASIC